LPYRDQQMLVEAHLNHLIKYKYMRHGQRVDDNIIIIYAIYLYLIMKQSTGLGSIPIRSTRHLTFFS
jgi:hypothetical protein